MITDHVQQAIKVAIEKKYDLSDITPQIVYPDATFGDFATNVAFQLAKQLKKSPVQIAEELAQDLSGDDIAQATAVNGFINLEMSDTFWLEQLKSITSNYGHSQIGEGTKVEIEFISANPTGPTTIGNARGGFIGDVLSNVLETQGYQVTREYYFNNAGTQISKLLESVKVSAGLIDAEDVQYSGDYIKELAQKFSSDLKTKPDDELKTLITSEILQRYIEPAIEKMHITFDSWFNEADLVDGGQLEKTTVRLKEKGLVFEKGGAQWLDTAKLGLKREARVLVKSNGDPTYLAPDIAFHDDMFGRRGFDKTIKVLGADHIDQFPSVKAAVLALHPDKEMDVTITQWLRLMKDGKEVKISKRLGQFVTVEELIDEVGSDVARFMTLMRSADTGMDFDLELAKEQSQKNPLLYVMYSYARANSILQQAAEKGITPVDVVDELHTEEIAIIRHISRFPGLLQEISRDYGVHRLTFCGIDLAKRFHDLYENERIINLEPDKAARRLYTIQQYVTFMQNYFKVLGITPVERMERDEPSS